MTEKPENRSWVLEVRRGWPPVRIVPPAKVAGEEQSGKPSVAEKVVVVAAALLAVWLGLTSDGLGTVKFAVWTIMFLSCAVMLYAKAQHAAGVSWGKRVAIIGAIVTLACGLDQMIGFSDNFHFGPTVMQVHVAYTRIAGIKLGKYLAAKCPGAKALMVVEPRLPGVTALPERADPLRDGIRKGLSPGITVVAEVGPEITKEMLSADGHSGGTVPPPIGPFDMLVTPEVFDKMLTPYAGKFDMIITMVGLPGKQDALQLWKTTPPPKVVSGTPMIQPVRSWLESGHIVAWLAANPRMETELRPKMPPADIDAAFNKRYLLITPDNVAQMAKEYPELFAAEKADPGQTYGPER